MKCVSWYITIIIGEDKMDWEGSDALHTQTQITQKQYDCGICSSSSPSTDENPIGLIILVQVSCLFI